MCPDSRRHRGFHPRDPKLFGAAEIERLRDATADLSWLLTRDYSQRAALKIVGDRYKLRERQRLAVSRGACSEQSLAVRRASRVGGAGLKNLALLIDGFNLIITVEAALAGAVLLGCRDGCVRDLSSVHGSYRSVAETERAIRLIGETAVSFSPNVVSWVLDRPVSNSGRLAVKIREIGESMGFDWPVTVEFNPDRTLIESAAVAATSDSGVLDRCARWFDLGSEVLARIGGELWVVDLRRAEKPGRIAVR